MLWLWKTVRQPALCCLRIFILLINSRICPGKRFATSMLTIFVASVLHAFKISAGTDEEGRPVELSVEVDGGMIA